MASRLWAGTPVLGLCPGIKGCTEPAQWRFTQMSLVTLRRAGRLERDLRLNAAGVALALELMDEIEHLKRRLARFEQAERAGNLTKD